MALDTRYRPQTYDDVLGQEATVSVLKQFVVEGRGYHQSYVFCGQHGSGKTTTGRILARALLCEAPVDGAPCDECPSCLTLLRGEVHECFVELDAATKSGKADLAQIIEDVSYSTVSGKRRIYLFDESHRMSKQALDVLLKPMEDNILGSEDKKLVCIFCTTEPEKMVSTIFSRCAPAFRIRPAPTEAIADRLAHICDQESITYESDALVLIAEQSGSHIRDAIKMVEGISMLGGVSKETVSTYFHLDSHKTVLDVLERLQSDLPGAIQAAESLTKIMSPSSVYEKISEAAMVTYKASLGVGAIPFRWDSDQVQRLSEQGSVWLSVAQRFSTPPHRPTSQTLILDVASAHHLYGSDYDVGKTVHLSVQTPSVPATSHLSEPSSSEVGTIPHDPTPKQPPVPEITVSPRNQVPAPRLEGGVYVDPRAIGQGPPDRIPLEEGGSKPLDVDDSRLSASAFRELFRHHLRLVRGRSGRNHMGGS